MQQKRIKLSVKNSLTSSKISEKSEIKSRGGQCNENLILLFETIKAPRHLLCLSAFITVSSLCFSIIKSLLCLKKMPASHIIGCDDHVGWFWQKGVGAV